MKITPIWILIASLYRTGHGQAVGLHQKPFLSVKAGEAATLHCTFDESLSKERLFWYKQKLGQTLQLVGTVIANLKPIIVPKFEELEFELKASTSSISLTIQRTTNDDEGMYFCGKYDGNAIQFSSGTFLAVTGHQDLNISVFQTPVRGRNCEHCSAEKLKDSVKEKTIKQDEDAEELNYAALNFHERKTKRGRGKREQPQEDTLYSAVRGSCVNDRRVTH
ncbi:hypothetical protein MHYP_G00108250 [Metynnis hypsauchen]